MKKYDVLISEKLKGYLTLCSIGISHTIKFQMEFFEHNLVLKLLDMASKEKSKIKSTVHQVFKPLYTELPEVYLLNYALIKSLNIIESNKIMLIIYNPTSSNTFSIILKSMEVIGILFNKKVSREQLNHINRKIVSLINFEVKFLIEQFLFSFSLLRDCLDPQKCENTSIEEILLKAYINGKSYYNKYMAELKKNSKLKSSVEQTVKEKLNEISRTLNQYDNNSDRCYDSDIDNNSCNSNNPRSQHSNNNKSNLSNNNNIIDNNSNININNSNERDSTIFSPNASFDSLINEFKLRTSVYIEETIILFFQVVSIDHSNKNIKNLDKTSIARSLKSMNETEKKRNSQYISKTGNRNANYIRDSEIGRNYLFDNSNSHNNYNPNENFSESTKTNSDKKKMNHSYSKRKLNSNNDILETPKFCDRTKINNNQNNDNIKNQISFDSILKQLEQSKKSQSFVPPIDTYNIFLNTSEIIHRKFFEIFFEEFLGKIFCYEKDKDNLIKLDSLYNYFIYLRGLKNILFIEKNRIYFSNVFFMDDEEDN